ncbi:helicase, putative [Trypanosoma equiperdum]|uniref:Helicase, putative n=2 Tax=Trypanozoon TaxID=39700 RepID=Q57ZK3_TRYB2|nr:helicase, putative [Trypanosoma brucei brucei TREU927]AAX79479.1 helicase, putative [Trypanosoma brucei]AAZ10343.1 helicase, putative [Trypanosoma brucei brucei TREU927]SCU72847.1 helicase, putative [Trypanosoma equiperdum]
MSSVFIDGVEVSFPFAPYPVQEEYMRSVIYALKGSHNALLESPTGTGKTLCLLCGVLAWLDERRICFLNSGISDRTSLLRVVYCSRTHAQLSQVIREFKRTRYSSIFSMAVLGSRDHMCLNSQVLQLPSSHAQRKLCSQLREDRNCRFYRGYEARAAGRKDFPDELWIHDMEDLVSEGRKCGFCPYYYERDAAKDADVVFLPYNYVFDVSFRKQLPFELSGSVLIVDEAHNLPSVLGSASCMNLQPLDLANAICECSRAMAMQRILSKDEDNNDDTSAVTSEQEFASLKVILCGLEACIVNEPRELPSKEEAETHAGRLDTSGSLTGCEIVRSGSYMISFLRKAAITHDIFFGDGGEGGFINEVISKALTVLSQSESTGVGLSKVQQFLSFVFERCGEGDDDSSYFILTDGKNTNGHANPRTLSYWCLDISRVVQSLVCDLHSLLLTSGTLSPLSHFAMELGVSFEVCLKGSHVIEEKQVIGSVLCRGPGGERLNGGYAFRNGVDYRIGLGMALVNISRITPGGILVFFPSYVALNAAVDLWRTGGGRANETETVWAMLEQVKPVFVEPAAAADAQTIVTSFQREVDANSTRGAFLLAVCRGRISEGIDFADQHGRCVVIAGIPFANHTDLFVRLKREYITRVSTKRPAVGGKPFTGNEWYMNEAMRSVNQCVGRVIRHKDDYGAVVLADERFVDRLHGLSEWVGSRCTVHSEFRGTYACIAKFFAPYRRRSGTSARQAGACAQMIGGASSLGEAVPGSQGNSPGGCSEAAKIPSSAEMAKRFAAQVLEGAAAEKSGQRRKILEEASEVPVAVSREFTKDKSGERSVPQQLPLEEAEASAPRPTFKKQVLPSPTTTNSAPPPTLLTGSSSKEFCQFLKQRLRQTSYDQFREILKRIAGTRTQLGLTDDDKKQVLRTATDELISLFTEAAGDRYGELLTSFGQHIPEEFQLYYAHLLRKRPRVS